jgi:hypothetical protein
MAKSNSELLERVIIERDDCFAIKFDDSEIIFEFEDSNERADQYQNAVDFLKSLIKKVKNEN